jgi:threonyl-tRNA synthetase
MIHAAIMGSIERFMSIYIEHINGHFPLWLAPTQVALVPVADTHVERAQQIVHELEEVGVRTVYYDSSESLGKRVREGEKQRIPYLLVIGDEEVKGETVAARNVQTKKQDSVAFGEFKEKLVEEIGERRLAA